MGGGVDLHVRPNHYLGADANGGIVQQGGPHVDVAALAKMDVAAIGAVEGRADKGTLGQLTDDLQQQRQLFIPLVAAIEAAVQTGRLLAQQIQFRCHAVVRLAGDHLVVLGHGGSCGLSLWRLGYTC